jgi:thiamine biosynthesis lipoprotein ApbE
MPSTPVTLTGVRRRNFALLVGWFVVLSLACPVLRAAEPGLFQFHHEGVLGTSLDLQVRATDEAQAALVESTALAEIERLRKILSSYDPESEISRFNASTGSMKCSPELLDVLGFYDLWNAKSAGAYNGHLGDLIAAWKAAEKAGVPPDAATLMRIVPALRQPGWKADRTMGTAMRFPGGAITIDSLGKGYIISKAAVAVRAKVPAVQGFLLNVGGDIFASGVSAPGMPWTIGVADPKRTADNAPPLTRVRITNRAISTSAAYERGFTVARQRLSHILDPRTGLPAEGVASATAVASNTANSNALATALCVLTPEQGLALVRQTPETECLIVAADGRQLRSPGFASLEVGQSTPTAPAKPPAKTGGWPAGYEVALTVILKTPPPGGKRGPKRPYVAVWIEDESAQRVRTVAVWGNKRKYLPDLRTWWKVAREDEAWAQSVTRATRPAGQHRIAWDGLDDQGKPMPAGTYTVLLEVNREHGTHSIESGKIVCGKTTAKATINAATEFEAAEISFGPAGK